MRDETDHAGLARLTCVPTYETFVGDRIESSSYHHRYGSERAAARSILDAVAARGTTRSYGVPIVSADRIARFGSCGSHINVYKHIVDAKYRLRGNYCRDRLCPACANALRLRIRSTLHPAIDQCLRTDPGRRARMLLLTLRHTRSPLKSIVRRIKSCWRRLVKTAWFSAAVAGGIWSLECKYSGASDTWHVHLHGIVLTSWLEQSRLAELWSEITGDSYVVDVRPIIDKRGRGDAYYAAAYVSKYITKPANLATMHVDQGADLAEALHGQRLWTVWGTLATTKAALDKAAHANADNDSYVPFAALSDIILWALSGCPESRRILRALHLTRPASDSQWSPASPGP